MTAKASPCEECRSRHLKCDGRKPVCRRCEQSDVSCVWGPPKIRFIHGSSARYDTAFAADQPWPKSTSRSTYWPSLFYNRKETIEDILGRWSFYADPIYPVKYRYVDETADIASSYTAENTHSIIGWPSAQNLSSSTTSDPLQPSTESRSPSNEPAGLREDISFSPPKRRRISDEPEFDHRSHDLSFQDTQSAISISPVAFHSDYRVANFEEVSPRTLKHDSNTALKPHLDLQEACLMRYFITHLAHWFDLCDERRHFASTVPSRAMTCPTLLNAIYTTSARHISRIKKYYVGEQIRYQNTFLPDLKPETALFYHNRCIEHLVSLSDDPMEVSDENLLAAAVILRFYEEVDVPFTGEDTEHALDGIQVFLNAEAMSATNIASLRHAAYLVALRQEILTAFSKQRPFRIPLEPCHSYRTFEPASDYVWANRLVLHCADVLQYCFGTEKGFKSRESTDLTAITPGILLSWEGVHTAMSAADSSSSDRITRYDELIAFETRWAESGPSSFNPIHYRDPDKSLGEVFPGYWYLSDCHIAGIQHLELARILLAVHNPRLPRLGPNYRAAMSSVDRAIKTGVLRLCGIAICNEHSPPSLVTASVAIAMCGDRFHDKAEQEAFLEILSKLDNDYSWPTQRIRTSITEAWGWHTDGLESMT